MNEPATRTDDALDLEAEIDIHATLNARREDPPVLDPWTVEQLREHLEPPTL